MYSPGNCKLPEELETVMQMIFRRRKHIRRYRQIILVFAKHGFGTLMDHMGILSYLKIGRKVKKTAETEIYQLTVGQRLRLSLEELGTTFIKLGQILSTRPELLPPDIMEELEKLQDAVPPFPFAEVRNVIEDELGDELENIFASFEKKPLAAASIAQVHLAEITPGNRVVVKVQRPKIERYIKIDIEILEDLADFIDNHTKYGKLYNFSRMIQEFKNSLADELNFRVEGENAVKFRRNFQRDEGVIVPNIFWMHTTRRVLTMEYVDGTRINDIEALDKKGIDRKLIAYNLTTSLLNQMLRDGFFHADPHPGNIMVVEGNVIAFLDLGMVGRLSEQQKTQFLKMLRGISTKNSRFIIDGIIGLNAMPSHVNMKSLEKDIDTIRDKYSTMPLSQIRFDEVFREIFDVAFLYNIELPSEFTLLIKALMTLEGIVEVLDPQLSVLEVAEPMAGQLILRLFSPGKIGKEVLEGAMDYGNLAKKFPSSILNFIRKLEEDEFALEFKLNDIDRIVNRFDKAFHSLQLTVVLLAVSIIIGAIIISFGMTAQTGGLEAYVLNLTVLKIGLALAAAIVVSLIISVLRSGRY